MNFSPLKGAAIRFVRVIAGAGAAAAVAAAINYQPILEADIEGAGFGFFVVFIGAGLTALDKYLRAKGVYGTAE